MKKLMTAIFAGALLATSPAWAHGGGHGHGHGKHSEKEWRKANKHWAKHHRHDDRVVVHQHVHAGPAVVHQHVVHERVVVAPPPAPAPGVHVVLPGIYFPF